MASPCAKLVPGGFPKLPDNDSCRKMLEVWGCKKAEETFSHISRSYVDLTFGL